MFTLNIGPFEITSDVSLPDEDITIDTTICNDDTIEDIIDNFESSCRIEKDDYRDTYHHVLKELYESTGVPDLDDLYSRLFPNKHINRDIFIGIQKGKTPKRGYTQWLNVGMNYNEINHSYLQQVINEYYDRYGNNTIIGYILYLMFERIHPFEDGNGSCRGDVVGRVGRLLFIENISSVLFPFSKMIKCLKPDKIISECFKEVSFTLRTDHTADNKYKHDIPSSEYYKLHVTNKLLCNIKRILLLVQEFKILNNVFGNNNNAKISHMLRKNELDPVIIHDILGQDLYRVFETINFSIDKHNEVMGATV